METPNDRLKQARIAAGCETAEEGAARAKVPANTYRQHENDTRNLGGIPRKKAEIYAKVFRVSLEWLLTGKGESSAPDPIPSEGQLEEMLSEAIRDEVTVDTKLADLPRIVASNLREQLRRFESQVLVTEMEAARTARDTAAQAPAPTKGADRAISRNS